jgi:hypothetical protein
LSSLDGFNLDTVCSCQEGSADQCIYRLKGELLEIEDSGEAEAEEFFQREIEIARKHSDRASELQATTSLAKLLRNTGRRAEARIMPAKIYNWFIEGFDTANLKQAKALL